MPIYEYQCTACSNITEAWQSVADSPLTTCPECAGDLKKVISMSSFLLKGGGWYADGYASSSASKKGGCGKNTSDTKTPCKEQSACPAAASSDSASKCCANSVASNS